MSDEVGRVYHVHPPVTVRAVQLTADADWEAIAAWCGGQVTTRIDAPRAAQPPR